MRLTISPPQWVLSSKQARPNPFRLWLWLWLWLLLWLAPRPQTRGWFTPVGACSNPSFGSGAPRALLVSPGPQEIGLQLSVITCSNLRCSYLQSFAVTCGYLQLLALRMLAVSCVAVACSCLQLLVLRLLAVPCGYLQLLTVPCGYLRLLACCVP